MVPFEYRALDLLADYETRFVALPGLWRTQIQRSSNQEVIGGFSSFLWALVAESLTDLSPELTNAEFKDKLGDPNDRDRKAAKLLEDLGLNNTVNLVVMSYFAGRRNILEDERCWVRFTKLIDDEIDIRAC